MPIPSSDLRAWCFPCRDASVYYGNLDRVIMTKTGQKPARPPNCFILFRNYAAAGVVDGIDGVGISGFSGVCWSRVADDVKALWKNAADQVMDEHARLHPGYKYRPESPQKTKTSPSDSSRKRGIANLQNAIQREKLDSPVLKRKHRKGKASRNAFRCHTPSLSTTPSSCMSSPTPSTPSLSNALSSLSIASSPPTFASPLNHPVNMTEAWTEQSSSWNVSSNNALGLFGFSESSTDTFGHIEPAPLPNMGLGCFDDINSMLSYAESLDTFTSNFGEPNQFFNLSEYIDFEQLS